MAADVQHGDGRLLVAVCEASANARATVLLDAIGEMINLVLARESKVSVGPEQRLFELGMGSLLVIELRQRLEAALAVELPVTVFFKQTTLGELVAYILSEVTESAPAASRRPAQVPASPSPLDAEAIERTIASLSDEQAEVALLAKIAALDAKFDR